ncbi:Sbal_3080 family lipoprotein [Desulfovibrio gilichinskyi]|uniref:Lipoprotein n=1 Tax=Desulfovibrio gilichinskyi TaxID=1519643 RepID=A0A1X7DSB8_9BACT|nr:Sbal_3080 family lipoprotein [Desulfovibrio gilichinskyi]SMF20823.1 hypothetical protein SAMN06295933_2299 [Desulfovibrio gilichinskyi]
MKILKLFCLVSILSIMTGCGKFDVINRPAPDILQAQHVCIIEDPETRPGFLVAMEEWLNKEKIAYQVVPQTSNNEICDWTLRYYGRWSWDLALFLSDAEISAYHLGKEAGKVNLRVGQWDSYKFEKGSTRISKMMDMLSSKIDHYPLPNTKPSKKDASN